TRNRALPGTGFIPESGALKLSGHATLVAVQIAGPRSAGQGVRAVHAWTVDDWLGKGFMKTATADPPGIDHPARVFNHSWIGSGSPAVPLILRRVDYLIDERDVLMVCGLGNGKGKMPELLASAYNVISVGVASGRHSNEPTTIETPGRRKPDLVAPGNQTSYATGLVTGVVAAMLEHADRMVDVDENGDDGDAASVNRNAAATRAEVIKAALLAGARRTAQWSPIEGEPLDRTLGAGVVEIDRALVILDAGHAEPDRATNQRYGWSFSTIDADAQRYYDFSLDAEQGPASFALVWHRRVLGGRARILNPDTGETRTIWNAAHFTPDLDLGLVRLEADGGETLIRFSQSDVDNVELIHLPALEPGRYRLRVRRKHDDTSQPWDYALAWRIEAKE
ncbi:MAG: S8 family serine peptidase, partial [Phycisphaeraceae bacterium]